MPRADLRISSVSQPSSTFKRAEHFTKGFQEDAYDSAVYSTCAYLLSNISSDCSKKEKHKNSLRRVCMDGWTADPQRKKIKISSSFKWRFSFSSPLASSKIWKKNIQGGILPADILIISWCKFCKPPPMSQTAIPSVNWLAFLTPEREWTW